VLVAQGIGRFGNYFNQELFGIPTTLPWGLEIPSTNPAYPNGLPDGLTFHPTFLYEMIWNFAGAALILYLASKLQLQWGKVFGLYLVVYSLGRIWIESIRIDPSEVILGLRINIWSALIGVVIGIIIIWVQSRRHPGLEPSVYAAGREPAEPMTEAVSADNNAEQKN
jgi:prolipoprotein diacylglyceryl transferase